MSRFIEVLAADAEAAYERGKALYTAATEAIPAAMALAEQGQAGNEEAAASVDMEVARIQALLAEATQAFTVVHVILPEVLERIAILKGRIDAMAVNAEAFRVHCGAPLAGALPGTIPGIN